ncbi:MAG: helix-hairpin-helix domain-containing protein, partial [Caldilineaceae bacterium]|nr:helix-hairpin-helix domain-containing protein [Caldilineaceae bacterium]
MLPSPVPINSATADEIGLLYDIGPHRAEQIVQHRTAAGPFRGPTDLAKVIPSKLAYTLAPHIDWRLPEEPMPPKVRSWSEASIWMV